MYLMPAPSSKPYRVDSHFHLFTAAESRAGARYVPGYDADFGAWHAAAAAAGIVRGVLVQPSFLGADNSRLCKELRAHPETLRGIAVIDPRCDAGRIRELASCGVRGIRLNLSGASHDVSEWKRASGVWDEMLSLGWHLELHTDVGALPGVLHQLPAAVPLVVDHMARPAAASPSDATIAMLAARARRHRVHVKLSGAYRLQGIDAGALARVLRDELGPHSLLWGSDWPCTNYEAFADYPRLLGALEGWVGPEATHLALTANPAALYWASPPRSDFS